MAPVTRGVIETYCLAVQVPISSRYAGASPLTAVATVTAAGGIAKAGGAAALLQPISAQRPIAATVREGGNWETNLLLNIISGLNHSLIYRQAEGEKYKIVNGFTERDCGTSERCGGERRKERPPPPQKRFYRSFFPCFPAGTRSIGAVTDSFRFL